MKDTVEPVFYDIEASSLLNGFPIEVGYAFVGGKAVVRSAGYLIRPTHDWDITENWDDAAQEIHGITLGDLMAHGLPAYTVAREMNDQLEGRELFADSSFDEPWLRLLFDAAGLDPSFTVRQTLADVLFASEAALRGIDALALGAIRAMANLDAPRRHRAEADARHLASTWALIKSHS